MHSRFFNLLSFVLLAIVLVNMTFASTMQLSHKQYTLIAKKIWRNEGACKSHYLLFWSPHEAFASLGIGHFIWAPKSYQGPFVQGFPAFVQFAQQHSNTTPHWLTTAAYNPWATRHAFYADKNSLHKKSLQQFLQTSFSLQAQYLVFNFNKRIALLSNHLPNTAKKHVQQQLQRLMQSPNGFYALLDYINFKGDGTNTKERYHGYGWGLLQVLQNMQGNAKGKAAIVDFTTVAGKLLKRRIHYAPPARHEQRWYAGWVKRLATYENFHDSHPCG